MSYEYVIDSYAWVEYFKGTKQGELADKFIESKKAVTSVISIAELSEKYHNEGKDFQERLDFIISKTKIINIDQKIAQMAGKINFENKKKIKDWGMADSIILATGILTNAKVVTGDEHFRTLNSVMLDVS